MPKPLLLFCIIFLTLSANAQKKVKPRLFYYTSNWKETKDDNTAVYLGVLKNFDDSTWQWWYYHDKGPLVTIETYKDEAQTLQHGYFAWYDEAGRLDSLGYLFEGKKDKEWLYYTDSFKVYTSEKYDRGTLLERKDRAMYDKQYKENDTMKLKPGEIEAKFKGGEQAWRNYMTSIKISDRVVSSGANGTVRVMFVVLTDGSVGEIKLLSSVQYYMDEDAMNHNLKSPRWEPAVQAGKNVRAYRIQPITVAF